LEEKNFFAATVLMSFNETTFQNGSSPFLLFESRLWWWWCSSAFAEECEGVTDREAEAGFVNGQTCYLAK